AVRRRVDGDGWWCGCRRRRGRRGTAAGGCRRRRGRRGTAAGGCRRRRGRGRATPSGCSRRCTATPPARITRNEGCQCAVFGGGCVGYALQRAPITPLAIHPEVDVMREQLTPNILPSIEISRVG